MSGINQFETLPYDKLYEICEGLETKDLSNLMKSYKRVSIECKDIMDRKNAEHEAQMKKEFTNIVISGKELTLVTTNANSTRQQKRSAIYKLLKDLEQNKNGLYWYKSPKDDKLNFTNMLITKWKEALNQGWPEFEEFRPLLSELKLKYKSNLDL